MKVIRLFAKSFQFLGEARGRYLLGVALGACELALLFATPTINQMLIDIVTGERQGNVVYTLLGMLAVFLLLVPPVVAGRYLQATAAAQGSAHLRKKAIPAHLGHARGGTKQVQGRGFPHPPD